MKPKGKTIGRERERERERGGGILRLIFTEYVPLASQPIPWLIIDTIVVTFEEM